ncbi:MAG: hypothetical protein ABIR62_07510 [Dokdonella sp.]|uniref:hypothetical protein n=1 Tax=Dokdonella sp. TaxID=2291710 RepID=UPI003263A427
MERDLIVFGMARRLAIPIVVSVAGGYQAADAIAKINTQTVRCALQVYASPMDQTATGSIDAIPCATS